MLASKSVCLKQEEVWTQHDRLLVASAGSLHMDSSTCSEDKASVHGTLLPLFHTEA